MAIHRNYLDYFRDDLYKKTSDSNTSIKAIQKPNHIPYTDVIKLIKRIDDLKMCNLNTHSLSIEYKRYSPSDYIEYSSEPYYYVCDVYFKSMRICTIGLVNLVDRSVILKLDSNFRTLLSSINPSLEMMDDKIDIISQFELFESAIDYVEDIRNKITNFWI